MTDSSIAGFRAPTIVGQGEVKLPVYVSEAGTKPLVVLHELPGMTPSFIAFCRRMADGGYKVHMPLLFKSPGTEMGPLQSGVFCLSREFRHLFAPATGAAHGRPFAAWLIELVGLVAGEHPGARIGVVGMCLTGSFAVAAIAVPGVEAAVICQPSFPFFANIATLGLSQWQRDAATARAKSLQKPCAKGYRFKYDRISRPSHMRAIEGALGDAFARYPDLAGWSHSTLTGTSRSEAVFDDVERFLSARL